jgi:[ribosomal protein S18]-alanine N-acetyltransferase
MTATSPLLDRLRAAEAEDAAIVADLQASAFDEAWGVDSVRGLLALPANLSFLAIGGEGRAVGFLIGQCMIDVAEIISIAVDPRFRRQGWARAMLDGFTAVASARGAERVILDVAADNVGGLALYRTLGFDVIARRNRYYATGRPIPVDALVMAKTLS